MKRARPAPSMFTNDSDSDEATKRRPARLKRFSNSVIKRGDTSQTQELGTEGIKASKEEDTLDAFMNKLHTSGPSPSKRGNNRAQEGREHDSDDSDNVNLHRKKPDENGDDQQPNENENELARDLKLKPVDYSNVQLSKVAWSQYEPLPRVKLTAEKQRDQLQILGASVYNASVFPLVSFEDLALELPKSLLAAVLHAFATPTPIQKVAIPGVLAGRDIIGIAKTGSGKTAAYGIPLLSHVARQSGGSSRGAGPVAIVLSPTRELATQITTVLRRFDSRSGVLCVVGGHAKYEQFKRIRDSGAEVIVATPGRLIDMLKMRACSMTRCSFVVVDEADRMFDLGFTDQVRAIMSQVRPDSQRLLFSATFPKIVRGFAEEILRDPVRVEIKGAGGSSMVNESVTEKYRSFLSDAERMSWLLDAILRMREEGLVIVFCATRGDAAAVANSIRRTGIAAACIHGETDAADREDLLKMFRSGELPLLVTTDLSARGLDIEDVRNIVNYGCAKSWEWHVHRAGRTGRAGRKGTSWTLVVKGNKGDSTFLSDALRAYGRKGRSLPDGLGEIVESGWELIDRSRGRGRRRRGR